MVRTLVFLLSFLSLNDALAAESASKLCDTLAQKKYSADYVPAIDVHGRPVVPADLNASTNNQQSIIKIPVSIDLLKQIDQKVLKVLNIPDGMELDTNFGELEIHPRGKVVYNGKELSKSSANYCKNYKNEIDKPAKVKAIKTDSGDAASSKKWIPIEEDDVIYGEAH